VWFFSFWSVAIVADAAHSSFGRSALIAAFNAGAGILGFPTGGWLSDVCALTVAFGIVIASGQPSVWLMAALLFCASTFLQRDAANRPRDDRRHRRASARPSG
jgi:ACS family D-galactonate transporter-like MFS transporter